MPDEATELYRRVCNAYARCGSYWDAGEVVTTFFGDLHRTDRRPFSTQYVRSQGFLFEFKQRIGPCSGWTQSVAWTEGEAVRKWNSRRGEKSPASLRLALAGLTGVSGGSAHRVPHLLMPELFDSNWNPPRAYRLVENHDADTEGCVVLELDRRLGTLEQLWIEQATCLVRRVVMPRHALGPLPPDAQARAFESMKRRMGSEAAEEFLKRMHDQKTEVESVTTYHGAFDVPLTPNDLRFTPPAATAS